MTIFSKSLLLSTVTALMLSGCSSETKDVVASSDEPTTTRTPAEDAALKKDILAQFDADQKKTLEDLQKKFDDKLATIKSDNTAAIDAAIAAFKVENDATINSILVSIDSTSTDIGALKAYILDIIFNKKALANIWYNAGVERVEMADLQEYVATRGAAKNIILFIGDGMGVSTVTAARILEGQRRGESGEENMLSFDKFPIVGLSKTYNTNSQTPDSAGTMSAMMTGVKTDIGVLSVSEAVVRGDCNSSKGIEMMTALELAEDINMSTGIISTARITHATPAATYAHTSDRNFEHTGTDVDGCKDIATQLIDFNYGDGIDVVMGGGRREFLPTTVTDVEGKNGKRTDGVNLVDAWKAKYPSGVYIQTQADFDAINTDSTNKIFGLFNYSHMQYEADRKNDVMGEPSIAEMTQKAIKVLSKNDKGFFLMVEGGRIDHAHHAGNAYGALSDTIALAQAVEIADEMTSDKDTLIIVTADHSHVFTIAGYPKRGNPILGKVQGTDGHGLPKSSDDLASDGMPYTTLGYNNGRGFMDLGEEKNSDAGYGEAIHFGRADLSAVDTTNPGFHQEAVVPRSSETHSGEDVGIYVKGPGAHLLSGVNEQNMIFHVMEYMGNLTNK